MTHTIKLVFAKLYGEMNHERSSNGKVEQSEQSVQPQHWRTEGGREGGGKEERERERFQLRNYNDKTPVNMYMYKYMFSIHLKRLCKLNGKGLTHLQAFYEYK